MAEVYVVGPATAELMAALQEPIARLCAARLDYLDKGDYLQAASIDEVLASVRIGSYRLKFERDGNWNWNLGPPRQVESA